MNRILVVLALLASGFAASAAPPSPDGTAITAPGTPPSLTASFGPLTDASGNTWTVVAGVVSENAKPLVITHGVFELLLCKGVIWQEANAKNNWWAWNGTAWSAQSAIDPTPTCPLAVVTPPPQTMELSLPVILPPNSIFTITFACPGGAVPVIPPPIVKGGAVSISSAMCPPVKGT